MNRWGEEVKALIRNLVIDAMKEKINNIKYRFQMSFEKLFEQKFIQNKC